MVANNDSRSLMCCSTRGRETDTSWRLLNLEPSEKHRRRSLAARIVRTVSRMRVCVCAPLLRCCRDRQCSENSSSKRQQENSSPFPRGFLLQIQRSKVLGFLHMGGTDYSAPPNAHYYLKVLESCTQAQADADTRATIRWSASAVGIRGSCVNSSRVRTDSFSPWSSTCVDVCYGNDGVIRCAL